MPHRPLQSPLQSAQLHSPRVPFAGAVDGFGIPVQYTLPFERPALKGIPDLEGRTPDPIVCAAIAPQDLSTLDGHVTVVGQVLVDHRHGEVGQGAISVPRDGIEQAQSGSTLCAARDLGGIDELFPVADPSAIEGAGLVEQLGALGEELAVLVEPDLVGTEVEHEVVGHDLTEIRYQRHVKCEGVPDAHLHVEASVQAGDRLGPLSVEVGTGIGVQAESGRRRDALDAGEQSSLVHEPFLVGVHGPPNVIRPVAADVPIEVHAPALRGVAGVIEAEDGPGQGEFCRPSVFIDAAFGLPDGIPAAISIVDGQQFIGLHAIGCDGEADAVHAIVEAIEPDAEDIGIAAAVSLDQLVQNAVGGGVPHAGTDVQGPVIEGEPDFGLLSGFRKRVGLEFPQLGLGQGFEPGGIAEVAIHHDGLFRHADGHRLRLSRQVRRPFLCGTEGDHRHE